MNINKNKNKRTKKEANLYFKKYTCESDQITVTREVAVKKAVPGEDHATTPLRSEWDRRGLGRLQAARHSSTISNNGHVENKEPQSKVTETHTICCAY